MKNDTCFEILLNYTTTRLLDNFYAKAKFKMIYDEMIELKKPDFIVVDYTYLSDGWSTDSDASDATGALLFMSPYQWFPTYGS